MPSIVIQRCYPALVAQGEDLFNKILIKILKFFSFPITEKRRRSPTPDQNRDKKTSGKKSWNSPRIEKNIVIYFIS